MPGGFVLTVHKTDGREDTYYVCVVCILYTACVMAGLWLETEIHILIVSSFYLCTCQPTYMNEIIIHGGL